MNKFKTVALLFASAYANQEYFTAVNVISRSAVIFITVFFCGVIGMQNVLPVAFSERYLHTYMALYLYISMHIYL